ncbi:hypothetical protein M569_01132 [Genlisea aurea]|uniref:cytokinin dehydrogenase n=1 Tax=Genlisea aurea TaxID=192259 RepID=S8D806_9LAMI|nr:hypothetical protein M569_01132 [Genlisea aurea]
MFFCFFEQTLLLMLLLLLAAFEIQDRSISTFTFDGHLSFEDDDDDAVRAAAAEDFGRRCRRMPSAVLYPESVSDVSKMVKYVYGLGSASELAVAARGRGHSLQGQAQAHNGVVIDMQSLRLPGMIFHLGGGGGGPWVEVSGGELWINVLHRSRKHGLAPRSWTDYLHLSVGGTLSNGGISGQAFLHGPQIDNVHRLQVVTETENKDLFEAVLGGLGQFGIITRARIALEPAPRKVKWIRALYSDFSTFTADQEALISSENDAFDYVEGFVIINRTGLLNNWRSSFNPRDPVLAEEFTSEGKILYCLEVAKYFSQEDSDHSVDQEVETLLSGLNYIKSTLFISEVSYVDFLDRVHFSEMKLREKGLWDLPHPWLNLLIPRKSIHTFAQEAFGSIVKETTSGPVLIYPVNKSRWRNQTSFVTPEEDIFYMVAFLSSAVPSSNGSDSLENILARNKRILALSSSHNLGIKQYLPHYSTREEWETHFGTKWDVFRRRKMAYDPLAILAPGQRIFQKGHDLGRE